MQTELSYMRHLEAGWTLKVPEEKPQDQPKDEQTKRTRKARQ